MEINANVYVIADDWRMLKKIGAILLPLTESPFSGGETIEPNAILPLTRTWYGYSLQTGMTSPDYEWEECVYECACLLKKKGAVIVQFWSPDHPDDYQGYVYTTANGGVDTGSRCSLYSYKRALGADDIKLVYEELLSGRTQRERDIAAERKQRKEALRKAKGDFEIIGGVLKKYRGTETDETIPDGVIEISEFAFVDKHSWERMLLEDEGYDAPELETLIIPSGVQKIGTYALAYCTNLKTVSIPDTVTVIEERAFEGCEALVKMALPNRLNEIADYTFFLCDSLESISIPDGVVQIGPGAFFDCRNLKRAVLPDSVQRIGKEAFQSCASLTSIKVPQNVKEVERSTFKYCDGLKQVKLPNGLKRIGDEAFYGCKGIKEITIPMGVEEIGQSAFEGCYSLEKVTLPNSLKSIGDYAFKGCRMLQELNCPEGQVVTGRNAFDGCWKLNK